MGAGRLQAVDPTLASGFENVLKSMCLRGKGNSTFPMSVVWSRSQHGTEQGLAGVDASAAARVNIADSGMSQVCAKDTIRREEKGRKEAGKEKGEEWKREGI